MNIILIIGTVLAFITTIMAGLIAREFLSRNEDALFTINFNNLKRMIVEMSVTKKNYNFIRLEFNTLVSDAKELNRVKELDAYFREKFTKFIKQEIIKETPILQSRIQAKIMEITSNISDLQERRKGFIDSDPDEYMRITAIRQEMISNLNLLKSLL